MKYIHTYDTIEEFEIDYADDLVSAVTSITCELGVFTYVDDESSRIFVWKNGDLLLETQFRNPSVGELCATLETPRTFYEITDIQAEDHDPAYVEPWISYTREDRRTHYNKEEIINFQPYGFYNYSRFGITGERINEWIDMIDMDAPLDEFGVLILSNPMSHAGHDTNYIYFYDGFENIAQISIHNDHIEIYRASDTK